MISIVCLAHRSQMYTRPRILTGPATSFSTSESLRRQNEQRNFLHRMASPLTRLYIRITAIRAPAESESVDDDVNRDRLGRGHAIVWRRKRSVVPGVSVYASPPTELAILDALIQLEADVSAEALRPLFDRWPVQVLILLAHASEWRDDMLLSILESTSGERWAAAANLLLVTRSPGLARYLLKDLRLKLMVSVRDSSSGELGAGFGGGSGCSGNLAYTAHGFPPLAEYSVRQDSGRHNSRAGSTACVLRANRSRLSERLCAAALRTITGIEFRPRALYQ
jgi:hypothetical protein